MDLSTMRDEDIQLMIASLQQEISKRNGNKPNENWYNPADEQMPNVPYGAQSTLMQRPAALNPNTSEQNKRAEQALASIAIEGSKPAAPENEAILRDYMKATGWTVNDNVPTEALVKNFQKVNRLPQTGVLDNNTMKVLAYGVNLVQQQVAKQSQGNRVFGANGATTSVIPVSAQSYNPYDPKYYKYADVAYEDTPQEHPRAVIDRTLRPGLSLW